MPTLNVFSDPLQLEPITNDDITNKSELSVTGT